MRKKLYRLRSNEKTIVFKTGILGRVFWSESMEYGYDSSWMLHKWNPKNVIPLTKDESAKYRKLRKEFVSFGRK